MAWVAERQRIEEGDRPRAHREHVAQNTADAGRSTLIWLDIARGVVALPFEHDGEPIADIDDAGVFARSLDHPRRLGWQRAQMNFRRFIRAMFVPHRRENTELGEAWCPAEKFDDALVFRWREPMLGNQFGGDGRFVRDHG